MRIASGFFLLAVAVYTQRFTPGETIEYKDGYSPSAPWEKGIVVKMLPGGTQALIRKKPSQFFPDSAEAAVARADLRKPQTGGGQAAAPIRPAELPPPASAGSGLPSKEEVLAYAKQLMGPNPWANPSRDAILDRIRDYITSRRIWTSATA